MRYWITTVSRIHVQNCVAGGFTQADGPRLKRLAKGDRIIFNSPRTDQRFTAIGEVIDDTPYEVEMSSRRRIKYAPCDEASIQPLIEQLEFIRDKKRWGFPFRRGFFEIGESDFKTIAQAMGGS